MSTGSCRRSSTRVASRARYNHGTGHAHELPAGGGSGHDESPWRPGGNGNGTSGGWGPGGRLPGDWPGIVISMSHDPPNGVCTGINDARQTLKGIEQGVWRPFTHNRQETLIRRAGRNLDLDRRRIVAATGARGMWEIRRADLYAYIHGWGMPEVTKGFQLWNWSRAAWGPPQAYAQKPDDQNPWVLQDYTRFVLEDPRRELPYFWIHTGWGGR